MMETVERSPSLSISERKELFERLYETVFPMVAELVSNRKGTLQDAKDIFQDSLIIFYEKILEEEIDLRVSEEAYVLGIAKHLWFHKFKADRNHISLSDFEAAITIPNDYFPEIQTSRLHRLLELTGKKCLELLTAFYYHKQSIRNIADTFDFASERSATVQKFKCMEKLRDSVKDKSMRYEDFTE